MLDFFLSSKEVFIENNTMKSVMDRLPPDYQCTVAPHIAKDCIFRTSLFKNSSSEFLSLLFELVSLESFTAGETIFRSGDVAHSFYIIKSGTCLIVNDCDVVMAELTETDIIGEISCFYSLPRSNTCVCSKFCEIYTLSSSKLAKVFKIFPDFVKSFSAYCRKKVLIDLSYKRQLRAAMFGHKSPSLGSQTAPPFSPILCSQQQQVLPKKLITLDPLPKGKFRSPKIPQVPEMIRTKTLQLSHEERVKLVAEIQVFFALCICSLPHTRSDAPPPPPHISFRWPCQTLISERWQLNSIES